MKLNVHSYDGALPDVTEDTNITQLRQSDQEQLVSDKMEAFKWLIEQLKQSTKCKKRSIIKATKCVTLVTKHIHQHSNNDETDSMYCCDILYLIILKMRESPDIDIMPYLREQLEDVVCSGKCPQGRLKRMYQIYSSIYST